MSNDLISRSALIEVLRKSHSYHAETARDFSLLSRDIRLVKEAPAVNAETYLDQLGLVKEAFDMAKSSLVPVVRCKGCRYLYDGVDDYCCSRHAGLVKNKPDSFCSYGERKADGEA